MEYFKLIYVLMVGVLFFMPGNTSAVVKASPVSCGAINGVAMSSAPTSDFCYFGTPTPIVNTGSFWTWSCVGLDKNNVQTKINCSIPRIVNGICGPANGVSFASVPSVNLCSSGTPSSVYIMSPSNTKTSSSTWAWTCSGLNGGLSKNCTANRSGIKGDYTNFTTVSGPTFFPPKSFGVSATVLCDKGDIRVSGGASSGDYGTYLDIKKYKTSNTLTSQTCSFSISVGQKGICSIECKDSFPYHKISSTLKSKGIDIASAINSFRKELGESSGLANLMKSILKNK